MSRLIEKLIPIAAGAGIVGAVDFMLVEGAGGAGVVYDLANDGYLGDFIRTRDPSELLDLNELNMGEAVSAAAILASLMFLLLALRSRGVASRRVTA